MQVCSLVCPPGCIFPHSGAAPSDLLTIAESVCTARVSLWLPWQTESQNQWQSISAARRDTIIDTLQSGQKRCWGKGHCERVTCATVFAWVPPSLPLRVIVNVKGIRFHRSPSSYLWILKCDVIITWREEQNNYCTALWAERPILFALSRYKRLPLYLCSLASVPHSMEDFHSPLIYISSSYAPARGNLYTFLITAR